MFNINRFSFLGIGFLLVAAHLISCGNQGSTNIDAKSLKEYGPEVKLHERSKAFSSLYPNHGNNQKLKDIAEDYLGGNPQLLNALESSKEFKPNYMDYRFEVDDLPIHLKGFSKLFSMEDRQENRGKRQNIVVEFVQKDDARIRSGHTLIVDFSELANSLDPEVKYGFDKDENNNQKLHIKKLKSTEFNFIGTEKTYFIGASQPLESHPLALNYDTKAKRYSFKTNQNEGLFNLDIISDFHSNSKEPLQDDIRYAAIVSNIKAAQNKYIKSRGYYKLEGVCRALSNLDLQSDYPLRDVYKGEAIMKHLGTSLSDGQSYIKLIMNDTHIGMLVDVNGYISQYQQVTVDKERGVVDKIVLVRK